MAGMQYTILDNAPDYFSLETYGGILPAMQDAATDRLEALLFGGRR